eukprot:3940509-Rhodomonas_salina.2
MACGAKFSRVRAEGRERKEEGTRAEEGASGSRSSRRGRDEDAVFEGWMWEGERRGVRRRRFRRGWR